LNRITPGLPQKEMEFVKRWQEEDILDNFFVTVS